jgi:hypothetical protein
LGVITGFFFGFAQPALYSFFAGASPAGAALLTSGRPCLSKRFFWSRPARGLRSSSTAPRRGPAAAAAGLRQSGRSPVGRFCATMCSESCSRITLGPTSSISPAASVPSANGP